mmetsp:Transcript_38148/g.85175  ORF Transcript_38148/g.85175 Transcript_38148/m.85175 type:complete len:239 (-) Transcript_38148:111-827(-)
MDHLRKYARATKARANAVVAAVAIDAQGVAHALAKLHGDKKHEYVMWVEIHPSRNFQDEIENCEEDVNSDDPLVAEAKIRRADFAQLARDLSRRNAGAAPGNPALPSASAALLHFIRVPMRLVGIRKKAATRSCLRRVTAARNLTMNRGGYLHNSVIMVEPDLVRLVVILLVWLNDADDCSVHHWHILLWRRLLWRRRLLWLRCLGINASTARVFGEHTLLCIMKFLFRQLPRESCFG